MSLQDILPSALRRKSRNDSAHLPVVIPVPVLPAPEEPETAERKALIKVLRRLERDANGAPHCMNVPDILKIVACGDDLRELPDLALVMFANGFAKNIDQDEPVLLNAFGQIVKIDGRSITELPAEN